MKLNSKTHKDITVIEIEGEIDLYNGPEIKQYVKNEMNTRNKKIIFNLDGVKYMDSSGIGVFISCFSFLRNNDGDMVMINIQDNISSILDKNRLDKFFIIKENLQNAIQSLS